MLLPAGIAADAAGRALVKRIQDADRPALVRDDVGLRAALEADGVHVADFATVKALRRQLGDGLIIGAECPAERHACMVAAEDGADYVAVGVTRENRAEALDLIGWWQDVMTVPIVAFLDAAIEAGPFTAIADFISPPAA